MPLPDSPRTSIVIPAYNYERYVAQAIESALAQDDPDVEVIVVDDGSTDGTGEIAQHFGDRIHYIRRVNGGLPAARNTGITAARGKFLVFLDADDLLVPTAVSTFHERLDAQGGVFDLIGCSHRNISIHGEPGDEVIQAPPEGREVDVRDLVTRSRFCTTVMVRTEVIRRCGLFDESLTASEDRDMWIRIAATNSRVFVLSDILVLVRRHGENMSANANRQTNAIRQVLSKARRAGAVPRWDLLFWLRTWAMYHYQKSTMLWNRNQRWAARSHLVLSGVLWPWYARPSEFGKPLLFRSRRLASWCLKFKN